MPLERFAAAWRETYVREASAPRAADAPCVFCVLAGEEVSSDSGVLWRGETAYLTLNAYPYGSGHVLVLPLRHVAGIDELDEGEYREFSETIRLASVALQRAYGADGMNVGMNLGRAAGAGIPGHLHAHVLPRWSGDTNFMTSIAETRVLPESLASTWSKVSQALQGL